MKLPTYFFCKDSECLWSISNKDQVTLSDFLNSFSSNQNELCLVYMYFANNEMVGRTLVVITLQDHLQHKLKKYELQNLEAKEDHYSLICSGAIYNGV